MRKYETAFAETALQEGGWYPGNQARDTNPTMQGVTQKVYDEYRHKVQLPTRTVREMESQERDDIYMEYWVDASCDLFGPYSAPLVFDHAFNAGPGAAIRVVQRCLGLTDDGKLGPKTQAAITAVDDGLLALRLVMERLISYDDISDNARLLPNLKAWVGRLTDYSRKYLRQA